jgi:hypothetical protein
VISDRNYQDVYSGPGNFVTTKNQWDRDMLKLDGHKAFLMGDGYSDKGQFPFIDQIDLKSQKKKLYESFYTDKKENLLEALDMEKGKILVRIESPTTYPNYYILKTPRFPNFLLFLFPFLCVKIDKPNISYA